MTHPTHTQILLYVLAINALTFFFFWYDKHSARRQGWRISEGGLLLLSLLGGSPAGFIAQRLLRHKTRKTSFQLRFWIVVIVQIAAAFYYYSHFGK